MKKTIAVISAALAAAASFAAEYHWRGSAPDMTENGKSGSWSDISNWTDASGNAAADYPHAAGDVAVFHGMAMGGYVEIADTDSIELAELRFEEGNNLLYCGLQAHVAVTRMIISDDASFEFASNDTAAGWEVDQNREGAFLVPDFTVGNRSELLPAGTGGIRGGLAHCSLNLFERRGYLTIDAEGKLTPMNPSNQYPDYGVGGDTVNDSQEGLYFGGWASYRGLNYEKWGHMSAAANYELQSGMLVALSHYTNLGKYDDQWLGVFSTGGAPLYFWGFNDRTTTSDCYIRSKMSVSTIIQPANSMMVIYDDHSTDDVQVYRAIAGGIRLGGIVHKSADAAPETTCTMPAATYEIGWNATLDVACEGALNAASTISVKSYNGKKGDFGTVNLGYNATVNKMLVDGAELDAGTYGATGSGAENIRDDIFTGTGVLTVTNGEAPAGEKPLVIMFL